jgi:hypothetical protein
MKPIFFFFHPSAIAFVIAIFVAIVIAIIIAISAIQTEGDIQLSRVIARGRDDRTTRRRFAMDRTITGLVTLADLQRQVDKLE